MPGASTKSYGSVLAVRDVGQAAAHEALDRDDGVLRIVGLRAPARRSRSVDAAVRADSARPRAGARGPASSGRHSATPLRTVGDQRVGGAEVDADREPALVRVGRLRRVRRSAAVPWRLLSRSLAGARRCPSAKLLEEHAARAPARAAAGVVALVVDAARRALLERRAARASIALRSVSSAAASFAARASSSASRHSICCIRNSAGIAVLFSASTSTPCSSHR